MCSQIPQYGNRSEVVLKVLHRSYLGGDEFLGQVSLPLQDFDVYEKPKAKYGDKKQIFAVELTLVIVDGIL